MQHPTQKDLTAYLEEIKQIVEDFKSLDQDIGVLRNNTKKDYNSLNNKLLKDFYIEGLDNNDKLFESYKERYAKQYHSFNDIIDNLAKLIKSAEHPVLTEASKKTFSAITQYSLSKLQVDEDNYKKSVDTYHTLLSTLKTLLANTIDRFENAKNELNAIDAYIHTAGVLGTIKYATGYGAQKTRTFEAHPQKNKTLKEETEEDKKIPVLTEEVKLAETKEPSK